MFFGPRRIITLLRRLQRCRRRLVPFGSEPNPHILCSLDLQALAAEQRSESEVMGITSN
ncbi:unnamed protein product, partial [Rodentolepis nana]|uniref:Uncharacterized protein n=1 Tax=Rodentolepis nana TaxID=102285 RepID=A0A0R3TIG8_RODNA